MKHGINRRIKLMRHLVARASPMAKCTLNLNGFEFPLSTRVAVAVYKNEVNPAIFCSSQILAFVAAMPRSWWFMAIDGGDKHDVANTRTPASKPIATLASVEND